VRARRALPFALWKDKLTTDKNKKPRRRGWDLRGKEGRNSSPGSTGVRCDQLFGSL